MGPGPQLSLRFIVRIQCSYRHFSTCRRKPDYYKILGVHPESTSTEIKTAYLRLCQVHHPDKGGSKHKFSEIQEAFEALSKVRLRYAYDAEKYATNGKSRPFSASAKPFHSYNKDASSNFRSSGGRNDSSGYYYGISGVSRVANIYIVIVCVGICMVSAVFHYIAVNTRLAKMRREAFAKSEAAYEEYNKTKMAYDVYGRDGNLKRIFGENVIVLNEQEFENVKQKNDGETKQ